MLDCFKGNFKEIQKKLMIKLEIILILIILKMLKESKMARIALSSQRKIQAITYIKRKMQILLIKKPKLTKIYSANWQ
jgi:hypothetical protein